MIASVGKSGYLRREALSRCAVLDPELPQDLMEQLWRDPASLIHQGEMLRRTSLRRTVLLTWGSKKYVLKQYKPTWWHFLRQLPLRSWAAATFRVTHQLIHAGIATPKPVACVENRWGTLRRDSFLMYEYVEGVMLRTYLAEEAHQRQTVSEQLTQQISDFWRRLDELRIGLADAHTGNFIVCPAGRLWIIDLDKTRFHRWPTLAARQQKRAWQIFVRSAGKSGPIDVEQLRIARAA